MISAFCLFLLLSPINKAIANDAKSSKANLIASGSQFIKKLTQLCNNNRPTALEFPNGFNISNISVACETALVCWIETEKYFDG